MNIFALTKALWNSIWYLYGPFIDPPLIRPNEICPAYIRFWQDQLKLIQTYKALHNLLSTWELM